MRKLLMIFLLGVFLVSLASVSALDSLGTFKQGDTVRISQVCSSATFINISSIAYPNSTIASSNNAMISSGSGEYYINFIATQDIGRYDVRGISDGCTKTFTTYFEITQNGQDKPSGNVIIFFIVAFIIILFGSTYTIISGIGHAINLDFDIIDLSFNYGLFFSLVGLRIAQDSYLGNIAITNIINWAVNIGIFVLMVLPTIYFILTLTIGSILSKRVKGVDY